MSHLREGAIPKQVYKQWSDVWMRSDTRDPSPVNPRLYHGPAGKAILAGSWMEEANHGWWVHLYNLTEVTPDKASQ